MLIVFKVNLIDYLSQLSYHLAMNQATIQGYSLAEDRSSYRDNLPRHLIALSRYLQSTLMNALRTEHGHQGLRMHFEPFMTLVGERGARNTDLVEQLGISKQAVNQALKQIEGLGYLAREPDPDDGRARRIVLTRQGHQLMEDGAVLLDRVELEFQRLVGREALHRLTRNLAKLYRALNMPRPSITTRGTALGWLLPRIADQVMQRLMASTRERSHPQLKMSFAQVLTLIGPDGGRMQAMAKINGVSKQAIGAIAAELEALDYLRREADPDDARQLRLVLTTKGERLLEDSVVAVRELDDEFASLIGRENFTDLVSDARSLYQALRLEAEVFSESGALPAGNLGALAARLHRQLGSGGCRELGQLLLNTAEARS